MYKERCSTEYELECTTGGLWAFKYQLKIIISLFIICMFALLADYVETCQPSYGGNVLLATYSEGESLRTGELC